MHSESLVAQVQLALIGIILVVGLFFMWRVVGRIEDKVDRVITRLAATNYPYKAPGGSGGAEGAEGDEYDEDDAGDERDAGDDELATNLTKDVSRSKPTVMFFPSSQQTAATVCIAEEEDDDEEEEPDEPDEDEEVIVTETDENSNPLSKTKLKKMNVDELKELCRQRGLGTDGVKNSLVDRLLGLTRD